MTPTPARRSLRIEAHRDDDVALEHIARATGRAKAVIAGDLLHAALHAEQLVEAVVEAAEPPQPDEPDDDWPTPAA